MSGRKSRKIRTNVPARLRKLEQRGEPAVPPPLTLEQEVAFKLMAEEPSLILRTGRRYGYCHRIVRRGIPYYAQSLDSRVLTNMAQQVRMKEREEVVT